VKEVNAAHLRSQLGVRLNDPKQAHKKDEEPLALKQIVDYKHKKYAEICRANGLKMQALAMDTHGMMSKDGHTLLNHIAQASDILSPAVIVKKGLQRLSVALQTGNAIIMERFLQHLRKDRRHDYDLSQPLVEEAVIRPRRRVRVRARARRSRVSAAASIVSVPASSLLVSSLIASNSAANAVNSLVGIVE
jgi:hypothetical protein